MHIFTSFLSVGVAKCDIIVGMFAAFIGGNDPLFSCLII